MIEIASNQLSPSLHEFMRGRSMEGVSMEDFGHMLDMKFHGHGFEFVVGVAHAYWHSYSIEACMDVWVTPTTIKTMSMKHH